MFLTEEDYKLAHSHGISRELADKQYYEYGWIKEKALTTHITEKVICSTKGYWKQYQSICDKNGITYKTFSKRVERRMKPEMASTLPLDTKYHKRSNT